MDRRSHGVLYDAMLGRGRSRALRRSLSVTALFVLATSLSVSDAAAAAIVVDSLLDDGTGCTLREAIQTANSDDPVTGCVEGSGLDTITFSVSGTITPATALPTISAPVNIDGGGTDATASTPAVLTISLDGAATSGVAGLRISAGSSTVEGLNIHSFQDGILLETAGGNTIRGNHIGTNLAGSAVDPNTRHGVVTTAGSNGNTIGGSLPAHRNVISGNGEFGITITSDSNEVFSNYIGTDATGTADLGNTSDGVDFSGTANVIGGPGTGNVVSGNGHTGIDSGTSTSGTIQGNRIGIGAGGQILPNVDDGIDTQFAGVLIGGLGAGEGNLISNNEESGIDASGGVIVGNTITDNDEEGITAVGAPDIRANTITGNADGGIRLAGLVGGSRVGGTTPGDGNIIASNGFDGVRVQAANHAILGNSIHSNVELGIDLAPLSAGFSSGDEVTPNDAGDADTGPNDLQNFPILDSLGAGGPVTGTLGSEPSKPYRIEVFLNEACDPSGFGEGATFFGSVQVTTSGSGQAAFSVTPSSALTLGQQITATATEIVGGVPRDTSEFSPCRQVTAAGVGLTAKPKKVKKGKKVKLTATVTPCPQMAGAPVEFQRKKGAAFVTIATATTKADCTALVKSKVKKRSKYRAVASGATSPLVTVKLKKPS